MSHTYSHKLRNMPKDTSWDRVGDWYAEHLKGDDTYHAKVILPNLLRVVEAQKGDRVLDLACGEGYFSRAFFDKGAKVVGIDSASSLIEIANKLGPKEITYKVATSDRLDFLQAGSLDVVLCVLAIQNIQKISDTFDACAKVLKEKGRLVLVINHPAFRIPKSSSWGFDEKVGVQYRRVDSYMSESKSKIEMHPGKGGGENTVSFHRPLQVYSKTLANSGFAIKKIEEWVSHRESGKGKRKSAEDNARLEFPLFMMIEAVKL